MTYSFTSVFWIVMLRGWNVYSGLPLDILRKCARLEVVSNDGTCDAAFNSQGMGTKKRWLGYTILAECP